MSTYNNFFIGIPIPEKYIDEYENVLRSIKNTDKSLKINVTNMLHITVLFMGKQGEASVGRVEKVVEESKNLLNNIIIEVKGSGYFKNKNYDVIYLQVKESEKLKEFYRKIKEELKETFLSEKKHFSPHLTLARVKNRELQTDELKYIENILRGVHWEFPITEINIYGRESENRNKQVVIRTIKI